MQLSTEMASVIKFVLASSPSVLKPYYDNVPENFVYPAVFFPVPEVTSSSKSISSYAHSFLQSVNIFSASSRDAYHIAFAIMQAASKRRNLIPMYNSSGAETGKDLAISGVDIRSVGDGVAKISLGWETIAPYDTPTVMKTAKYYFDIALKSI